MALLTSLIAFLHLGSRKRVANLGSNGENHPLLIGARALDLTDQNGYLCGRILADLGVDVIKIEPPGGCPGREGGKFYGEKGHPKRNPFWLAYNLGKRGITLNLESIKGREIFKTLARNTDFILESFSPGRMDTLGLGYDNLKKLYPRMIYASITPFGRGGPYGNYKASDLIVAAMGGFMYLTGDPDRPPVRISFPIVYAVASIHAALGAMIAFYHRQRTGVGQHVDTSAQESVVCTLANALPTWELNNVLTKRVGSFWFRIGPSGETKQRVLWPCADGSVAFMAMGGQAGERSNKALVQWMKEEGMADEYLRSIDWTTFSIPEATQRFHEEFESRVGKFFMKNTKRELHEGALKRGIFLQLVGTSRDTIESEHLRARNFWRNIYHPELSTYIRYPGSFFKASESWPLMRSRAPMIGEHNVEIYHDELGLSLKELEELKERGVI